MLITQSDYFGPWFDHEDATPERHTAAADMLDKVNNLLTSAEAHGVDLQVNPHTATFVAGQTYGGFRPADCPQGAINSSHKIGRGIDIFDPEGNLDKWLTDERLKEFGLYREAPTKTISWAHLTDRAPPSGKRTFEP